jgi:hypothetical protein
MLEKLRLKKENEIVLLVGLYKEIKKLNAL